MQLNKFSVYFSLFLLLSSSIHAKGHDTTRPRSLSTRANANPIPHPKKKKTIADTIVSNMSGTFALTTNYIFRGLTQTDNLPAIQGGLTYTAPIGLYGSVWGSTNKFPDTDITSELDPGIGFYKEFSKNINFDISFWRYFQPGAREWNYNEWLAQANFIFLQANLGYSNNVFNAHRKGLYHDGGINYTFPAKYLFGIENVTLLALIGRYELPVEFPDLAGVSYTNYTVSLSKDFKNYNIALQYSNTTEKEFYLAEGGEHFFCTLTASF